MRRISLSATVLGLAGLAVGGVLASGLLAHRAVVAAPGDAPRVAAVDVFKLLKDAPSQKAIDTKRKADRDAVEAFKEEQGKKLRALKDELEGLTKFDPRRRGLEENLARASALAEFEVKWRVARADEDYSTALEKLYAEVRGTIREVASANGFALVIAKTDDALNLERPSEFTLSVAMRPVLYADRTVDITGLVADRLAQATPPAPPAAPSPGTVPPAPSSPGSVPPPPPSSPTPGMR
jgi:Skp family chaperone for outer membrane proteins